MKKITFLVSFLVISGASFAQVNLQSVIKPGAKLSYAVEANEQKYNFIVTVKTLVPAVVFDWEMTDPVNKSGTITHTAAAMAAGNTLFNYFSGGSKTLDDNTLSVWISKAVFTGLTKGEKSVLVRMNTNETEQMMSVTREDPEEMPVIVNGEKDTIEEFTAKSGMTPDVYFSFSNSAKLPIILKMNNGFYIVLKEIKTK